MKGKNEAMTIVMVHGAWADGSSWSSVIRPVQAKGFKVVTAPISPTPVAGITKGKIAVAQFTAAKPGKYLMICGFPGHAISGMYGTFVVSPLAFARPSMTVAK